MAHVNMYLKEHDYYEDIVRRELLKHEIKVLRDLNRELVNDLQNIYDSVLEYGYVELTAERFQEKKQIILVERKGTTNDSE